MSAFISTTNVYLHLSLLPPGTVHMNSKALAQTVKSIDTKPFLRPKFKPQAYRIHRSNIRHIYLLRRELFITGYLSITSTAKIDIATIHYEIHQLYK